MTVQGKMVLHVKIWDFAISIILVTQVFNTSENALFCAEVL